MANGEQGGSAAVQIGTKAIEEAAKSSKLLVKFGEKYTLEPAKVYSTLMRTAFKDAQTIEQVIALLVVADQYGLNPFTREIYAFPDKKGGVVPVVGIDGWNRIAQQRQEFDGLDLRYSDTITQIDGAKPCPEWIEVEVHRKDREHPIVVREYLDECYQSARGGYAGPWQSHTKRMLRHKAIIQGYRMAFGFHGIYDPDEAERIADEGPARPIEAADGRKGSSGGASGLVLDVTPTEAAREEEKPSGEATRSQEADTGL